MHTLAAATTSLCSRTIMYKASLSITGSGFSKSKHVLGFINSLSLILNAPDNMTVKLANNSGEDLILSVISDKISSQAVTISVITSIFFF